MKKLLIALSFIPALHGYSIKVQFSDCTKNIELAKLDQFESTQLSSLFPFIHKIWPKKLKTLDSNMFKLLTKLSKLDNAMLFDFCVALPQDQLKLLHFTLNECKIENKLHLAVNMAFLKKDSAAFTDLFNAQSFAQNYLYDYFNGEVWKAKAPVNHHNSVLYNIALELHEDAFYSKYYGINSDLWRMYSNTLYKFTTLMHYHDQVLKKPLAVDTQELKDTFMNFDAQVQNHLVDNKFVALT